jgi:hypothetical protein
MSSEAHTAIYLAKEIIEVIESIGPNKICAIVSDVAAALVVAKKKSYQR